MLIGKSFSGKSSMVESLCNKKLSAPLSLPSCSNACEKNYCETPGKILVFLFLFLSYGYSTNSTVSGISVTHLYWPVKVQNYDKFLMFNLALWDLGKNSSDKYQYILPSSTENLDCFIFVFSWTDKQSFLEVFNDIKQIYQSSSNQTLPKLIIGTK